MGKKPVLKAAPVPFTVLSNLGDKPEEAQLKPIFGITPTSSFLDKYRLWILCGIGVLVLALVVGWWIQKRRGKTAAPVWKAPPHETAMRELKALDEKRLFEQGRIKDFYFDFSEILRRYVEAIRGFPAAEYTIEEISRAIKHKEDQAALKLLRQADMVKFADSLATPAGKTDHMESAFAYIRNTAKRDFGGGAKAMMFRFAYPVVFFLVPLVLGWLAFVLFRKPTGIIHSMTSRIAALEGAAKRAPWSPEFQPF